MECQVKAKPSLSLPTLLLCCCALATLSCCKAKAPEVRPTNPASVAADPAPTEALPKPEALPSANVSAPFVVTLTGPDAVQAGQQIDLKLVIKRASAVDAPAHIALTLPKGAALLSGEADESAVRLDAAETARTWRLRLDSVPTEDLLVTVAIKAEGFGFNGKAFYRFGRPAPKLPDPQAGGSLPIEGSALSGAVLTEPPGR